MNSQESNRSPTTILRLSEVLRMTGLSRSTIYLRIAKGEFPRQVSLGGRAIGWLRGDVEDWINQRIGLRPESTNGHSERATQEEDAITRNIRNGRREPLGSAEPARCIVTVNEGSPDPAQLKLVGTNIYFDKSTGNFWLKLTAENAASNR